MFKKYATAYANSPGCMNSVWPVLNSPIPSLGGDALVRSIFNISFPGILQGESIESEVKIVVVHSMEEMLEFFKDTRESD